MTEANLMNEQEKQSLQTTFTQKIEYLQSFHMAHLALVIQGRQSVIAELNETHRTVVHQMNQSHQDLINEMNETYRQTVATHNSVMDGLNESHRNAINEMNQALRETGKLYTGSLSIPSSITEIQNTPS